jgi:hypothetical protein
MSALACTLPASPSAPHCTHREGHLQLAACRHRLAARLPAGLSPSRGAHLSVLLMPDAMCAPTSAQRCQGAAVHAAWRGRGCGRHADGPRRVVHAGELRTVRWAAHSHSIRHAASEVTQPGQGCCEHWATGTLCLCQCWRAVQASLPASAQWHHRSPGISQCAPSAACHRRLPGLALAPAC